MKEYELQFIGNLDHPEFYRWLIEEMGFIVKKEAPKNVKKR